MAVSHLLAVLGKPGDLFLGIGGEVVDGHQGRQTVFGHVLHVLIEVADAFLQGFEVGVLQIVEWLPAMHLQCPYCRDDDGHRGMEPTFDGSDVEELLGPQIGAEPGLGDDDRG